jgi:hypothetical protein
MGGGNLRATEGEMITDGARCVFWFRREYQRPNGRGPYSRDVRRLVDYLDGHRAQECVPEQAGRGSAAGSLCHACFMGSDRSLLEDSSVMVTGVYGMETDDRGAYRWSDGQASIEVPGLNTSGAIDYLLDVDADGQFRVLVDGEPLQRVGRYYLLRRDRFVAGRSRFAIVSGWSTQSQRRDHDERALGVRLSRLRLIALAFNERSGPKLRESSSAPLTQR